MAIGRPIITNNVPGCNNLVKDGINGYLVKNQDEEDLRKKMLNFPYDKFDYGDLVNSIKKNHINKVFSHYEKLISIFLWNLLFF